MKPVVLDLRKSTDQDRHEKILKDYKPRTISSDYYFREIVKIRNPHISDQTILNNLLTDLQRTITVNYAVYYPWKNTLCYIPNKKIFFELMTARNKHLITGEEQLKLADNVVAFFGMSVGSQAALSWMLESRASIIKIIDHDTIDPSNLNRIRFGIDSVGLEKIDATARALYELNPFARVMAYKDTSLKNFENILTTEPNATVVVDEIDDIHAKYQLRILAKKYKLPLISAADVGDNVVLDVERYDYENQPVPFLGRLDNVDKVDFTKLSNIEQMKMIIQLVGMEYGSDRIPDSILSLGGSLRTWPQLGATATIAGGVVATTIKKIICGERVVSGRYNVSLDQLINKDFHSKEVEMVRKKKVVQVTEILDKF